jgi:hypothetical protein
MAQSRRGRLFEPSYGFSDSWCFEETRAIYEVGRKTRVKSSQHQSELKTRSTFGVMPMRESLPLSAVISPMEAAAVGSVCGRKSHVDEVRPSAEAVWKQGE